MTTKTKTNKGKGLADFIETPAQSPQQTIAVVEQAPIGQPSPVEPITTELMTPEPIIVKSTPEPLPVEQPIPGDPSAAEQMVSKADETISQLEQQLADIAQQITSAYVEMETFPQGRQERTIRLQNARATLALADEAHTKAVNYAKLAQGTSNEQGAVKAVSIAQKDLQIAKEALAKIEQEIAEADQSDQTRERELSSAIQTLQAEQERLQAELHSTRDARRQAHQELGEQRHTAIMAQAQEYQKRVDELRSQLLAAQVEQFDYIESVLPTLTDWWELRRQVRSLIPVEDATSRVIDASLHFMDTLIRERNEIKVSNIDMRIPRVNDLMISWMSFLVVSANEVEGLKMSTSRLQDRKEQLEYIQQEYKKHLAGS